MSKQLRIGLAVGLVLALGFLAWIALRSREPDPIVEGKPLTTWLESYGTGSQEADRAVASAGTNVIPTLLRTLRHRDSRLRSRVLQLAQKQHLVKMHYLSADERNEKVFLIFCELNVNAKTAVPALIEIYEQKISESSRAWTAASLGAVGPAAKAALPALSRGASDPSAKVRIQSIFALGKIGSEPALVVPALTKSLGDSDPTVRLAACGGLRLLGGQAKQAVPALLEELKSTDLQLRVFAAMALQEIDPDAAVKAGLK